MCLSHILLTSLNHYKYSNHSGTEAVQASHRISFKLADGYVCLALRMPASDDSHIRWILSNTFAEGTLMLR